jgi:signal recognition particle receptor subunit beta
MGIGKSTAIRALCGELAVDCDVENLDQARSAKATTTVGADYGVIQLDDGTQLHIYGSPGQERFTFVREWLMGLAIGAVILVDANEHGAIEDCVTLIREMEALPTQPTTMVVIARPATDDQIHQFSMTLAQTTGWPVPAMAADVRDRQQMLNVLSVLFSMLSVDSVADDEQSAIEYDN